MSSHHALDFSWLYVRTVVFTLWWNKLNNLNASPVPCLVFLHCGNNTFMSTAYTTVKVSKCVLAALAVQVLISVQRWDRSESHEVCFRKPDEETGSEKVTRVTTVREETQIKQTTHLLHLGGSCLSVSSLPSCLCFSSDNRKNGRRTF